MSTDTEKPIPKGRHLLATDSHARLAFPPARLQAIEAGIAQGETRYRGEVLLVVELTLDWQQIWRGVTPGERARALFARHGIWDTEDNCGVLIDVNLADRQVEIVTDRGIGRLVPAQEWRSVCRTRIEGFARAAFHDSVLAAINALNDLLHQHDPDDGSQRNPLPNLSFRTAQ